MFLKHYVNNCVFFSQTTSDICPVNEKNQLFRKSCFKPVRRRNSDKTIENKKRVCSPSTKKHHISNKKLFSSDSLSETETNTEVSNDVMLKKKPHQSKRQLNYSSDDETCTDKATILASYDHLPPPIVNVAQGSNSLSGNEDDWFLNVFNNER